MFSYQDWLRSVQLDIQLDRRIGLTIPQLGQDATRRELKRVKAQVSAAR